MSRRIFKSSCALAITALLALPSAVTAVDPAEKKVAELYELAKQEGEVIWYTTSRKSYTKNFSKFWKQRFPDVKLKVLRKNSPKLAQTVEAEMAAGKPRPDVVDMSAPNIAQIWKEKGYYEAYQPVNWDRIDPRLKDKDGMWTSRVVFLLLGAYNTNLIKDKASLPTTLTDLTAPKYKDQLLSAHPETAGSSRTFFGTVVQRDIAGGWDFLEKLGKQNLFYTTGNSGAARMIVAGERPLAVAISSHNILVAMDKGQPIDWFQWEDGAVINHSPQGLFKTASHPNAAKLLIEFTFSEEGQTQIAEWGRQWSVLDEGPAPEGMPTLSTFKLIEPDLEFLNKGSKQFLDRFGEIMGRRQ